MGSFQPSRDGMEGNADYNGQEAQSVDVTIAKATPVVNTPPEPADDLTPEPNSIQVTITSTDITPPTKKDGLKYDGTAQPLINEGSLGSSSGHFEYTYYYQGEDSSDNWQPEVPTGTNAGMYTVKWRVAGDDHYRDNYGMFTVTIDKADWNVTKVPSGKQLVANGAEQELAEPGESDGVFKYAVDANTPDSFSEDIPKRSEPGQYTVWYKIEGDTNHNEYGPSYFTVTIKENTGKQ